MDKFINKCRELVIRYEKAHGNSKLIYNRDVEVSAVVKSCERLSAVCSIGHDRLYKISFEHSHNIYTIMVYSLTDMEERQ